MILFNQEVLLTNTEELDRFCEMLRDEIFDEYSRNGIEVLINYLRECYEAGERLTTMVHHRIDKTVFPIVSIDFDITKDLNELDFYFMAESEDRELSLQEEMLAERLCDICFGHIKGLYDRFYYET